MTQCANVRTLAKRLYALRSIELYERLLRESLAATSLREGSRARTEYASLLARAKRTLAEIDQHG